MDNLYFWLVSGVAACLMIRYMLHGVGYYYEDSNGEEQAQDDKT